MHVAPLNGNLSRFDSENCHFLFIYLVSESLWLWFVVVVVVQDGSCRVVLGPSGNGEIISALPNEMDAVVPRKGDKIKIMGGSLRGGTGKLIGVDGTEGIVKLDDTFDVKIFDLSILAKLAQS